ncbi:I78 family peptidase inhibitor [Parasphingopyxis marina]|uniref:Peptidase inhibitor I78 family protein n=1 Tax=Parasphingopyxis marina TaxID=2761622 RepID=A0A842I127_9SPHN|nr:I78 family peptidase inhibitor [Parasphingopyxis marina]MBC2777880.1 hypothetical protein [Parasphingopyxis marina]
MNRFFFAIAATAVLAAGCAPGLDGHDDSWMPPAADGSTGAPIPVAGEGPCDAEAAQGYVGQPISEALGVEAMRYTGARELRWIAPDSSVTMDYRPTRLNIEYDEARNVTAIRCG